MKRVPGPQQRLGPNWNWPGLGQVLPSCFLQVTQEVTPPLCLVQKDMTAQLSPKAPPPSCRPCVPFTNEQTESQVMPGLSQPLRPVPSLRLEKMHLAEGTLAFKM